jgi:hypothetical protein
MVALGQRNVNGIVQSDEIRVSMAATVNIHVVFPFSTSGAWLYWLYGPFPSHIMERSRRSFITWNGRGLPLDPTTSLSRCTIKVLSVGLILLSFLAEVKQRTRGQWRSVLSTGKPVTRPDGTKGVEGASRGIP